MPVWAATAVAKPPDGRHLRGDQHAGDLVQLQPAVLLGGVDHEQPELADLAQQLDHQVEIVVLDPVDVRQNLVPDELLRRVANRDLLFGEVFRDEHVSRGNMRDQVFSAFQQRFGSHLSTSHSGFPG